METELHGVIFTALVIGIVSGIASAHLTDHENVTRPMRLVIHTVILLLALTLFRYIYL